MKPTVKFVNEQGIMEMQQFLTKNHKKGHIFRQRSRLMPWKYEAEISFTSGNGAQIEIKWYDSINKLSQTYTISDAGLDICLATSP